MTRLHSRYGWLLYANPDISGGTVLAGDVMQFELSAEHAYGGMAIRVACEMMPGASIRQGAGSGTSLEALMWDALQSWPEPGIRDGRRWPPEMMALLELARRHPEEYEELREGEAVLRALGG